MNSKTNILPSVKYSKLNIMQKINAKANRVAANKRWGSDVNGWVPNYMFESRLPIQPKDYTSPYNFSLRFPVKGKAAYNNY